MARAGPKKVYRYSREFKRAAVQLSLARGVQVQTVCIYISGVGCTRSPTCMKRNST